MILRDGLINQVPDPTNGKPVWEVQLPDDEIDLATDTQRVYAMTLFQVSAYDLNNGRLLWTSQVLSDHSTYYLNSDGEKLYLREVSRWEVYDLDTRPGTQLSSASLSTGNKFALLPQLPQFDLRTTTGALQAVDRTTQQPLWTADVEKDALIIRLPVLYDNLILDGIWGLVYAIDAKTGQAKWYNRDNPFASNFRDE
jgi:outer membrane protein assembly factor BamB